MPLHDLTLSQLSVLSKDIATLEKAGRCMAEAGMVPTFDLTPGLPMRILTSAVMPEADPMLHDVLSSEFEDDPPAAEAVAIPSFLKRSSTEAAPPAVDAAPVDPSPALGEVAGDGTQPSAPEQSVAVSPETATPVSAPQNDPQAVTGARKDTDTPAPWTEAEEDRLIGLVVDGVVLRSRPKQEAIRWAAQEIGRGFEGVKSRCYTKLRDRLAAAIDAAAMVQAQTETPVVPVAAPVVPEVVPVETPSADVLAASFDRPVAAVPEDLHGKDRDLWQHLQAHRPRWPHTVGTDLDLVVGRGRGDKLPMISADLGIDTEKLKARFQVLTRPIQDARGNVTLDGGPRLIALLRRIAKTPVVAA